MGVKQSICHKLGQYASEVYGTVFTVSDWCYSHRNQTPPKVTDRRKARAVRISECCPGSPALEAESGVPANSWRVHGRPLCCTAGTVACLDMLNFLQFGGHEKARDVAAGTLQYAKACTREPLLRNCALISERLLPKQSEVLCCDWPSSQLKDSKRTATLSGASKPDCSSAEVVLMHYDLWHRGGANVSSDGIRYMFKFQPLRRVSPRPRHGPTTTTLLVVRQRETWGFRGMLSSSTIIII